MISVAQGLDVARSPRRWERVRVGPGRAPGRTGFRSCGRGLVPGPCTRVEAAPLYARQGTVLLFLNGWSRFHARTCSYRHAL
jgi:hypothetical protein